MNKLTVNNKYCVYTCCDDNYIAQAIISLISFRNNSDVSDLYIFTYNVSEKNKILLNSFDINIIIIEEPYINIESEYSSECFLIFSGPELLARLGFKYSMYVDADTLCLANISEVASKTKTIAGVPHSSFSDIFGDDYERIQTLWGVSKSPHRIQSGVVFFNNEYMQKCRLSDVAKKLFKEAKEFSVPRRGDDSLLALILYVNPEFKPQYLSCEFNFICRKKIAATDRKSWIEQDADAIASIKVFHFTSWSPKPWIYSLYYPNYVVKYFTFRWRNFAIETLNQQLFDYFPGLHKTFRKIPKRFYWWPSNNVGDLVTSFLLNISNEEQVNYYINEDDINKMERQFNTFSMLIKPLFIIEIFIRKFFSKLQISRLEFYYNKLIRCRYVVSTGSVVRLCGECSLVYGSGIRSKSQPVRNATISFVRGPLTRAAYIEAGVECPPVYGDPGLLMPLFYKPSEKKAAKTYKLGIIPHFTEYKSVKEVYKNIGNVKIIDMGCGNITNVIDDILSCRRTVSSSLHGLVFSHAYNIPTRRIVFSNSVYGDGTKYDDYYMGIGIEPGFFIDAREKYIKYDVMYKLADELLYFIDYKLLLDHMFIDSSGNFKNYTSII